MAHRIAECVDQKGGRTFFVGGFVRDLLMGHDNKDVDIEIHGIHPQQLEEILDTLGKRTQMGVSFGVYGLRGYDLDIAMPRQEEATGRGHKDFKIFVDPFLGTFRAARRRDFTMNAMMQDVLTGEIVDHFHGQEDMHNGILRHVNSDTFVEDPLRVLRGAQFAARFAFSIADETIELAKTMDLTTLASERILGELEKALLKAEKPSVFFEEMQRMEQLKDWFWELSAAAAFGADAWTHTMQVLDAAAGLRREAENPMGLMLAALTQGLQKDSLMHFLKKITSETKILRYVPNLVQLHQQPDALAAAEASQTEWNHLFDQAICPADLLLLAKAVRQVREGRTGGILAAESSLQEQLQEKLQENLWQHLQKFQEMMAKPCVMGADLVAAGLKPGPQFSEILVYAHELRLAGVEKTEALEKTLAYAKTCLQEA